MNWLGDSNPTSQPKFQEFFTHSFTQALAGTLISGVSVPPCSAVHDCRSPLKTHVNLLPPSLNRRLDCGLLSGERFGQVELSFHDPIRSMFLDGELCRESAVLMLA